DPLSDAGQLEAPTHVDDGAREDCDLRITADLVDEAPVDLDLVERQIAQLGKARGAGAELVKSHANARLPQGLDGRPCGVEVPDRGLAHLHFETGRGESEFLERRDD